MNESKVQTLPRDYECPETIYDDLLAGNIGDSLRPIVKLLISSQEQARQDQVYNLTANVQPNRKPYFVQ